MIKRGRQLVALRDALKITQAFFEAMSGTPHSTMSKAENDKIEWNSGPVVKRMARSMDLTRDEFEDYLDDKIGIEVVLVKARPAVERQKIRLANVKKFEAIADSAVKTADIDDDLEAAVSRFLLLILTRDFGSTSMAELVREARAFAADLREKLNRRSRSHKSDTSAERRLR